MSNTVSTDLARRLAKAGLKWEPKVGDWVWTEMSGNRELVVAVREDLVFVHLSHWSDLITSDDCLWLPTLADCLDGLRQHERIVDLQMTDISQKGETWRVVEWPGGDDNPIRYPEHADPTEAGGLALAAVLEGEKANG